MRASRSPTTKPARSLLLGCFTTARLRPVTPQLNRRPRWQFTLTLQLASFLPLGEAPMADNRQTPNETRVTCVSCGRTIRNFRGNAVWRDGEGYMTCDQQTPAPGSTFHTPRITRLGGDQ